MIPVTKPFLPAEKEYRAYIRSIWNREWLTNNGPLVNALELKLKNYLKLHHLLFVTNGTVALQMAIKALKIKGEVITTPFSFVATTSSIVWQGCKPVFADINPLTFNIDPDKIEAAITPHTSAILATHVFGNPCDVEAIQSIADKYRLKVIYDAAHCFGTKVNGQSIFSYGDISTTSFHSTKLFHTVEGGGVFTRDPDVLRKLALMRNFGYSGIDTFSELGINAKNSEFHAAMGLCNINHIDAILVQRKQLYKKYQELLQPASLQYQQLTCADDYNYAYMPVVFGTEEEMLKCKAALERAQIFARRYFYPSLSQMPYVKKKTMAASDSIAARILCLPLYHTLTDEDLHLISRIVQRVIRFGDQPNVVDFGELVTDKIESQLNQSTIKVS